MSPFEKHHFCPEVTTSFAEMFHRSFSAGMFTADAEFRRNASERFGIAQFGLLADIPTAVERLVVLHHSSALEGEINATV
jgi:hypothetical protein